MLIATHDVVLDPKKNAQDEAPGTGTVTAEPAPPPAQTGSDQAPGDVAGRDAALSTQPAALPMSSRSPRLEFPLSKPAEGYVTRGFDVSRYHYGMDFAGKRSTAILAAADGNVVFSGWTYDDGWRSDSHGLAFVCLQAQ
jgi:murein DD-endopeptidase MepM/ murein hydrolase activator NlpD